MNNKKIGTLTLLLLTQLAFTGCASITKEKTQPIKLETYNKNNEVVSGAKCVSKNERGSWESTTPGPTVVHRSGKNLIIDCEKDGETASAILISRANGGMFGNILFGGGIGAIVDHNRGTAYSYPDWVRIVFGDSLMFDRKNNKDNEVMLGQAISAEELKKIEDAKIAEVKAAEEAAKKAEAEKK